MKPWLLHLARAVLEEIRQRYELACLLEQLRTDHRLLDDLGWSYDWIAGELRRNQRENSPLRSAVGRRTQSSLPLRRTLHDF